MIDTEAAFIMIERPVIGKFTVFGARGVEVRIILNVTD